MCNEIKTYLQNIHDISFVTDDKNVFHFDHENSSIIYNDFKNTQGVIVHHFQIMSQSASADSDLLDIMWEKYFPEKLTVSTVCGLDENGETKTVLLDLEEYALLGAIEDIPYFRVLNIIAMKNNFIKSCDCKSEETGLK